MTYETLKSEVADWLNRGDLTAVIPTFIRNAETTLGRRLRVRQMLTTTNLTVADEYEALPTDYKEWRALSITTADGPIPMRYVTPDRANLLQTATPDQPAYFTVEGTDLRFVPSPDASYAGRLLYYAALPALSADVSTNWLLDEAPDIYLYATLMEAAPYLRDDERVPLWEKMLEARIADLTADSKRSEMGAGPLVAVPPKGFD